jgi:hypothetical protein
MPPIPGAIGKWSTGWWFGTFFIFHALGIVIPSDYCNIFQRGRYTTNQISLYCINPIQKCEKTPQEQQK